MRKQSMVSISALIAGLAFSVAGMAQGPASVPAPEGWKQCPRCQNNKDRADAKAKYKVEGHASNPRDLSGVWGYNGIPATFRNPPPLTEWGKQRHAETLGDKNAAGAVVGVFVVKEFAGGILIAQCFRVPLFSPFRQRRRIPESCWATMASQQL